MKDEKLGQFFDKGKFKILAQLGEGGAGAVYKAEQKDLNRIVALKVLKAQANESSEDFARFAQESKILAELRHENIISIYSIGFDEQTNQAYLAMEFLDGKSLRQILIERSKLSLASTLKIAIQIAQAVSFAHKKGVVHRDLKPENIMVLNSQDEELVKVLDFGLARILNKNEATIQKLTQTGELLGSVVYMSPEQCAGLATDQRSDIYSLACIVYECLTGKPPFDPGNPIGLLYKHINEMPEKFVDTRSKQTFPIDIERIVFKAMQKDPNKRFQTMADFQNALELLQDGRNSELGKLLTQERESSKDNKIFTVLGLICAVVIGGIAAYQFWLKPSSQNQTQNTGVKLAESDPLARADSLCLQVEKYKKNGNNELLEDYLNRTLLYIAQRFPHTNPSAVAHKRAAVLRRLCVAAENFKPKDCEKMYESLIHLHMEDIEDIPMPDVAQSYDDKAKLLELCENYDAACAWYCSSSEVYSNLDRVEEANAELAKAKAALAKSSGDKGFREIKIECTEISALIQQGKNAEASQRLKNLRLELNKIFPAKTMARFDELEAIAALWERLNNYEQSEKTRLEAYAVAKYCAIQGPLLVNPTNPVNSASQLVRLYAHYKQFAKADDILKDINSFLDKNSALSSDAVSDLERAKDKLEEARQKARQER